MYSHTYVPPPCLDSSSPREASICNASLIETRLTPSASASAFSEADLRFHLLVAKATGNPIVTKVNTIIGDILKVSMYGIVESLGPKDGLHYHRKILDAMIDRDVPLAETLMEEHIERTIRRLKRKRDKDGISTPEGGGVAKPDEIRRIQKIA